jgi:bacterioferritin-associated ferredoxin
MIFKIATVHGARAEAMIVCQCAGVSDATIRRLIEEGANSLETITRCTGAGRCCAPCREEIMAMLALARRAARRDRDGLSGRQEPGRLPGPSPI